MVVHIGQVFVVVRVFCLTMSKLLIALPFFFYPLIFFSLFCLIIIYYAFIKKLFPFFRGENVFLPLKRERAYITCILQCSNIEDRHNSKTISPINEKSN